ncbi:unnamed protein product [Brassicogethes aeneus]|uniref:Uncharacterized protein n=1 Tax=Brassicogethes aeneus TaxID=1431903 RepID=A0A9P0FLM6_BRAAE|nr:unnamed protein product [Brassicogethes aeneus]
MRWFVCVVFWGFCACGKAEENFDSADVEKLASSVYGTELFLLENAYQEQKNYKLEDFFWTGSGDGENYEDDGWKTENPTTIYKTKTVFSTVMIETIHPTNKSIPNCIIDCTTIGPGENIKPTRTLPPDEDFSDADRQFWLLTVLKSDGKDPVMIDLKNSLAKLYKTAFQRQQDYHLGINHRTKRESANKPVKVYIHNVDKTKLNGDEKITVLYHVSVDGKPVPAVTAADDMALVTDEEVRRQLGYPFLIKAEPYIKQASDPQAVSKAKGTWLVIGVSIIALLVFLLFVAFCTLAFAKKKRAPSTTGIENRQHVFERGVGHENKAFVTETKEESPTYIDFRKNLKNKLDSRSESSLTSSSSSLDISPLMGLKKQSPPKKPPRPRAAAINKTVPLNMKSISKEIFDSDSSRNDSPDTIFIGNYDPGVMSPKSYLSMPSVKSFPRNGNMPEPLNKVLEPVSVLHLDMPEDEHDSKYKPSSLVRHGSLGTSEDPGIIGPVVWNLHCERMQHGVSVDEGIHDLKETGNVTKMRKRFHELLDDTFSLFGSRRESPVELSRPPIEVKSHSAVNTRQDEEVAPIPKPRPKTTDPRKVIKTPSPKGAWSSKAPSPLVRPLSSGIINHPKINVDHILAEGKFHHNDPAVPLIEAIKTEIDKCSLPGSTADLRE